ncbi:hypothetical protein C8J56DRAFT_63060 [Mycena floridula]|nr:hypothetical protein C8J56DRAFT_63060 [Mycena floridula]
MKDIRVNLMVTTSGDVYQVINGPPGLLPQAPDRSFPDKTQLRPYIRNPERLVRSTGWEVEGVLPYRGFIPVKTRFHDPLLKCLGYTRKSLPLECVEGGNWQLAKVVLDRWCLLENLLIRLRSAFRPDGVPFEYVSVPSPLTYLAKKNSDRVIAGERAWRARNVFLLLIAEVSHRAAMFYNADQDVDFLQPFIRKMRKIGISAPMEDQIRLSAIVDFEVPRLGLFVDLRGSRSAYGWDSALKPYLMAKIPLYLYWGHQSDVALETDASMLLHFCNPTSADVLNAPVVYPFPPAGNEDHTVPIGGGRTVEKERVLEQLEPEPWRRPWTSEEDAMGPDSVPDSLPAYHMHSESAVLPDPPPIQYEPYDRNAPKPGQRLGETWQDFFERKKLEGERKRVGENENGRRAREAREKAAATFCAPGKSGASTFVWEIKEGDFLVRKYVPRWQVADLWDDFTDAQKRYNPFENTWDLCSGLAPDEEPPADEDEEEELDIQDAYRSSFGYQDHEEGDDDDDKSAGSGKVESFQATASQGVEDRLSWAHEAMNVDGDDREIVEDNTHQVQVANLAERTEPDIWLPAMESRNLFALPWLICMKLRYGYVCPKGLAEEVPLTEKERKEYGIVCHSLCAKAPELTPDVARAITSAFKNFKQGVQKHCTDLDPAHPEFLGRIWNRAFYVDSVQAKGIFVLRDQVNALKVEVTDATTVLHVLRDEGLKTIYEVVSELLRLGIAFCPIVTVDAGERKPLPYVLGYRSKDWKPSNVTDFQSYIASRDHFLRHPVIARAALRSGGLVWRLALDANGSELLSSETYLTHYSHATLSQDDINAICGVYRVRTNLVGGGYPFAHQSWFPRPLQWQKSTFNVGFWCEFAEIWYQGVLQKIREGTFQFRNAGEWGSAVRLQTKRLRLAKSVSEAGATALYSKQIMI